MKKFAIVLLSIILVFGTIAPCAAAWKNWKEEQIRQPYEVIVPKTTYPIPNRGEEERTNINSAIEAPPAEVEEETAETSVSAQTEPIITEKVYTTNREEEAVVIAKIMYREARGIASITEQACVAWTILNRVDASGKSIIEIATAPNQFAWDPYSPTVDDQGRDLIALAKDIIGRWEAEKNGETDVGRVLPSTYKYFGGSNGHNWFRENYEFNGEYWDYSLKSPYES